MKRLLVAFGVVLGLALAGVLALPGFIDWNAYKGPIAERLGEAFGRDVTLAGDIRLTLLPSPEFSVSDARVANPPGFSRSDMMRLKRLDVSVALLPLIEGRIQVERVQLVEPDVLYEVAEDGRRNWFRSADEALGGSLTQAFSFDAVDVENGRVTFRDGLSGRQGVIEAIEARVVAGSLFGPFQIAGTATVHGVEMRGELTTGRLATGIAVPVRLVLSLPGGNSTLRAAGILATNAGNGRRFQGDLRAESANLAASAMPLLAAIDEHSLPPRALDQPFSLRASVEADGTRIVASSIDGQLGESRITGTAAVALGAVPDVQIILGANRFDLTPWIDDAKAAWPAHLPKGVTGAVGLAVDAMPVGGGTLRQARLEAKLADGVLSLDRLSALLPGGADIAAAGTLTDGDAGVEADVQVEANADNLRAVLDWLRLMPDSVAADRLRKAAVSLRIGGTAGRADISGIDLRLDTSRITGAVSYVGRARPALGIQLDVDRLNADAYATWKADVEAARRLIAAVDLNVNVSAGALTLGGVPLQGVVLEASAVDGAVDVRKLSVADVAGVMGSLSGRLRGQSPADPLHLTLEAEADSALGLSRILPWPSWLPPPEALGRLRINGRAVGTPETFAIDGMAEAAGATVEAGGNVDLTPRLPTLSVKARLRHPLGEGLVRRVSGRVGWLPALGPVDLYAAIDGTPAALSLTDLQGNLGDMPVRGRIDLALAGRRPWFDGSLQLGRVDIDHLLGEALARRSPLDLAMIGVADGRVAVSATEAAVGGARLTSPAARFRLDEGTLTLEQMDGGFEGGQLGLTGRIDTPPGQPPRARFDLTIAKAKPKDMVLPGGLVLSASGLDLVANASTVGPSLQAMQRALSGKGWFAARNGAVSGAIGSVVSGGVGGVAGGAGPETPAQPAEAATESTAFGEAAATFTAELGVLRTEDFRLLRTGGSLRGRGEVRLADGSVDLTLRAEEGNLPPVAFQVQGSIDHAYRSPLPSAAVPSPVDPGAPKAPAPSAQPDVIRNLLQGLRR